MAGTYITGERLFVWCQAVTIWLAKSAIEPDAMTPYFSIVIPMFNREQHITLAIDSCISQQFAHIEIIVVDDGSTDNSVSIVERINSPKLKLLLHSVNRGVCPARNTGIDVARGEWVICLDSDDELFPGVLSQMYELCSHADPTIGGIRFSSALDDGSLSPEVPFQLEIWGYEDYVHWTEIVSRRRQDSLHCVRRATFDLVRYPNDRSLEANYHLDFSRRFRIMTSPIVAEIIHRDAGNSIARNSSTEFILKRANDQANAFERLLANHGEAMKRLSPTKYFDFLRGSATEWFLARERLRGLRQVCRYLWRRPLSPQIVALALLGLVGPSAILQVKRMHNWIRANT